MTGLPTNASDDVKKLNPGLYGPSRTAVPAATSTLEDKMALMLDALGFSYQREYKFHKDRK